MLVTVLVNLLREKRFMMCPRLGESGLFWDLWRSLNGRKPLIRTNHPQFQSPRLLPLESSLLSAHFCKCHSIFERRLPSLIWCPSASGAERWCPPQLQLSLMEEACHFYDPPTLLKAQPTSVVACFLLLRAACIHPSLFLSYRLKKQNKRQNVWQLSIICCLFRQSWLTWICKYL